MDTETKPKYAPLLPFDKTFAENFRMYDSFAYENNRDMTHPHVLSKESGNIVKYFTCNNRDGYFKVGIDTPEQIENKYTKKTP